MAYSIINKTGCCERKGNLQIRFDFFLDEDDPRYEDCHILVPDLSAGKYTGKVDKDGNPTNQNDYDKWLASLPKVYQLSPFHSHFVYFDPDVTDEEIKAEMDYHLPNFYKAYQDKQDKIAGGMRHGFAVEKRLGCLDYSQLDSKEDFELRKSQVNERLSSLSDIQSKPISIDDGKFYPATTIDIGNTAKNRTSSRTLNYNSAFQTRITYDNTANASGTIDTVEAWFATALTGNVFRVGIFSNPSGTTFTCRSADSLGSVVSGSKQTFTGLSLDVETGDYIGADAGADIRLLIETDSSDGNGNYYISGQYCDVSDSGSFTADADYTLSLYGTGETTSANHFLSLLGVGG